MMRSRSPYPIRPSSSRSKSPWRARSPSPTYSMISSRRGTPAPEAVTSSSPFTSGESGAGDETTPLLTPDTAVTAVYGRRWYMLVLFSLAALLQTLMWSMWGPIAQSAKAAFGWEDSTITMSVWMGNVPFAALCIPLAWVLDYKGLRISMLLACFFMACGAGVRCLIVLLPDSYSLWCMYTGQFLNGMAGPVTHGAMALLSNVWFPNNQRATATAFATFVGYLGSALAFVGGPQMVPSPTDHINGTFPDGSTNNSVVMTILLQASDDDNSTDLDDYTDQRNGILNYLYYQAAAAGVIFLLVLVYFPDKPPLPPSLSAAAEREDFRAGLLSLVQNKQFWLITVAFCLSLGVFEVWDVVLDVNLDTIGISQEDAGWLGFYCVMAGCFTGLIICRLGDIFFRHIRLFLILAYVVSAIFILWFILIYIEILPFDMVSLYSAIILMGVFLDGCSPLVYELACEAAYPTGEGVSSCFLQMLFVLVGIGFTSVQEIPNIGTTWMNWCLLGAVVVAIPLLCCGSDSYLRAELDALEKEIVVVQTPINPSMQRDHAYVKDAETSGLLADPASSPSPSSSSSLRLGLGRPKSQPQPGGKADDVLTPSGSMSHLLTASDLLSPSNGVPGTQSPARQPDPGQRWGGGRADSRGSSGSSEGRDSSRSLLLYGSNGSSLLATAAETRSLGRNSAGILYREGSVTLLTAAGSYSGRRSVDPSLLAV